MPVSRVAVFLDQATARMEALVPGARVTAFGHMGDGNLHYDVIRPDGGDDAAHSALRGASGLTRRDPLYPWGAMWCLLPADGWPHPRELRQRYAGTRTMLGALPVGARPDRGDRHWLTFYYSLPGSAVDAFDVAALARMHEEIRSLWPELAERTRMLTDPAQLSLKRSWWR